MQKAMDDRKRQRDLIAKIEEHIDQIGQGEPEVTWLELMNIGASQATFEDPLQVTIEDKTNTLNTWKEIDRTMTNKIASIRKAAVTINTTAAGFQENRHAIQNYINKN